MSRLQSTCSRRGSALIVVIWVVGLLAMFITSMAFDAQVESRLTSYYRKRAKNWMSSEL
jgi:type II secretory pathway component PulK